MEWMPLPAVRWAWFAGCSIFRTLNLFDSSG
jgi:hypothetical protein